MMVSIGSLSGVAFVPETTYQTWKLVFRMYYSCSGLCYWHLQWITVRTSISPFLGLVTSLPRYALVSLR